MTTRCKQCGGSSVVSSTRVVRKVAVFETRPCQECAADNHTKPKFDSVEGSVTHERESDESSEYPDPDDWVEVF